MTTRSDAMDVRRQAGWLPDDQDDLESWLAGHRERVEYRGEQVALHPVMVEFQELIDTDPVVRMYMHQWIAQVPSTKAYSKRHLESVKQLLRLINEVLTMAPEFGESGMVATPLGAILDWTMGTPAGFADFRDPRINVMLKKILTAWCKFLSKKDSLYVLTIRHPGAGSCSPSPPRCRTGHRNRQSPAGWPARAYTAPRPLRSGPRLGWSSRLHPATRTWPHRATAHHRRRRGRTAATPSPRCRPPNLPR